MKIFTVLAVSILLASCSSMKLEDVKSHAPKVWQSNGWDVIGYEGYQWGKLGPFGYGGANVWHRLRRIPNDGFTYSGYIQKWGDEYHIYGPTVNQPLGNPITINNVGNK